MLAGDIQ